MMYLKKFSQGALRLEFLRTTALTRLYLSGCSALLAWQGGWHLQLSDRAALLFENIREFYKNNHLSVRR